MHARSVNFGVMLILGGGLYSWPWVSGHLDCMGSALYIIPFWVAGILAGIEAAYLRRYAFMSQYLAHAGRLVRLLRPGVLLLAWHSIKGLFLALLLMVGLLTLDSLQRQLLLADLLLLPVLLFGISRLLHGEIRDRLHPPLVRHWTQWGNALLLWIALMWVTSFTAQMNYTGLPWQEVVRFGAAEVIVGCDALAFLARIEAISAALALWAAQNLFSGLERPDQLLMAWTLFIASFGVSFLVAWIYSRVLIGAWAQPWRLRSSMGANH